ncbi:MAG: hypothetical protein COA42_15235 [Alteromonadaceae bacterium]|nr:MAG: hypothetical protein COA42_15235 [Alteromonadaceae bacterium]
MTHLSIDNALFDDANGVGNACESGNFRCGDADGNGTVYTRDARLIQRVVVGLLPGSALTCDGGVSSP